MRYNPKIVRLLAMGIKSLLRKLHPWVDDWDGGEIRITVEVKDAQGEIVAAPFPLTIQEVSGE